MKYGKRKKKIEEDNSVNPIKKTFEIDGMIFKTRPDYNYYLKLLDYEEKGIIKSFDRSYFFKNEPDEVENEINEAVEIEEVDNKKITKPKYKAKKVFIDDIKFDSRLEADFYLHALILKQEGIIESFELQPVYILQPSFVKNEKKIQPIKYIADFKVYYTNGEVEIIDVKGMTTPDFAIKRKMFEYIFPKLHLRVLKYIKSAGGWIEHDDDKKAKREKKKKEKIGK
jgi:hypothetical protein